MTKDEMKNRISMALKDPILQQSFEIICKENAELKSIADFQTSSNMDRYFQLKRKKEQLTKAKEIIKVLLDTQSQLDPYRDIFKDRILKAEQFLSEVEKND